MKNELDDDCRIAMVKAMHKAGIAQSTTVKVLLDLGLERNATMILVDIVYAQTRRSIPPPIGLRSRRHIGVGALLLICGTFVIVYFSTPGSTWTLPLAGLCVAFLGLFLFLFGLTKIGQKGMN
jgi:hypothetical protein